MTVERPNPKLPKILKIGYHAYFPWFLSFSINS